MLLIPTKELVFEAEIDHHSSAFAQLIDNEKKMWRQIKTVLEQRGIPHLDSLTELREALRAGIQPYKIGPDGHPNAAGHRVIAEIVARWIADPAEQ